jgi:hypothetical protein
MTRRAHASLPLATPSHIHHTMPRARNGFGLLAVIMFVGIIVTLLAMSYPALMHADREARVRETWKILENIRLGTSQIAPAPSATYPVFRQRVGNNPGRISQLWTPILSGDAVNFPDACGTTFNFGQQTASRSWAPMLSYAFDPAGGLATPMGVIDDDFIRTTLLGTTYLMVIIAQADLNDILVLDQYDTVPNDGAGNGLVRWDTITGTTARLTYMITTDATC